MILNESQHLLELGFHPVDRFDRALILPCQLTAWQRQGEGMTEHQDDFSRLFQEMREGSETATQELIARYGTHILRVVRQRLHRALRPRFDSQDFVQAVWASFFAVSPDQRVFTRPDEMLYFLTQIARNKVVDAVRQRLKTQKHNVNRECSFDPDSPVQIEGVAGPQPTPSQIVIAQEEWHRLVDNQPEHYQRILQMLREGHARQEVAKELDLNEKTVRRVLRKLSPRSSDESH